MLRFSVILAVAVFCLLTAKAPDPRVRAALDALAGHVHDLDGGVAASFYCPMDPDVRSVTPGTCPRCRMTLVEGAPDISEYPLDLEVSPPIPRANQTTASPSVSAIRAPRSLCVVSKWCTSACITSSW